MIQIGLLYIPYQYERLIADSYFFVIHLSFAPATSTFNITPCRDTSWFLYGAIYYYSCRHDSRVRYALFLSHKVNGYVRLMETEWARFTASEYVWHAGQHPLIHLHPTHPSSNPLHQEPPSNRTNRPARSTCTAYNSPNMSGTRPLMPPPPPARIHIHIHINTYTHIHIYTYTHTHIHTMHDREWDETHQRHHRRPLRR